jgi:hypothetical protein
MDCESTLLSFINQLRRKDVEAVVFEKMQNDKNPSMASVALVETGEKIKVSTATVAEKSQERLLSGEFCDERKVRELRTPGNELRETVPLIEKGIEQRQMFEEGGT